MSTQARIAFLLVIAGVTLAGARVVEHSRWDEVAEVSLDAAEAELPPGGLSLVTSSASDADIIVQLCSDEGLVEPYDKVRVEVVSGAPDTGEGAGRGAHRWAVDRLGRGEVGTLMTQDCLVFHGRGPGGQVELRAAAGALEPRGDTGAIAITTVVRKPLTLLDKLVELLLLAGAALLLLAGQLTEPAERLGWTIGDALLVLLVFFAASLAAGFFRGVPTAAFFGTLVSLAAYVIALLVVSHRRCARGPLAGLAFHRIEPGTWAVSAATGFVLAVAAIIVLYALPQGESPMSRLIQTSSGLVTVVTLALVAPWAEELLLRGAVYTAVERRVGAVGAVLVSAGLFSLLHLGQHAGNYGPWLVITVTGLALSLVRWQTGSSLASTITHLVYNLALAMPVLVAG